MGIAKMEHLNVYGPEKALRKTLCAIARSACFAPEGKEAIHSALRTGQNRYEPLLAKAKGLLKDLGHSSLAPDYPGDEEAYSIEDVEAYLERFAGEVARRGKRIAEIQSELDLQVKTEDLLAHMTDLDISIDDLFRVQTLKVRVGRLPKTGYARLGYYAEKGFNFTSYFNFIVYYFDGEYYWGMYFAPADSAHDIDDIFNSLYFERVWVPEFVHGRPEEALPAIRERAASLREELEGIVTPAGIASEEELARIRDMAGWLHLRNRLYDMRRHALVFNHMFYISGFVPKHSFAAFEETIARLGSVKISEGGQNSEAPVRPPVQLKNGWFSRPYEMYVGMYGLPAYGDTDPTGMVAVIYSVLFGLMFADIGQGLLLGLFGHFYMYRRRGMAIGQILARASIFSCLFGLLFGSVFGYEHLLTPVFRAAGFARLPVEVMSGENIAAVLLAAVGIGVAMVALAIAVNIAGRLRRREFGQALFGPNGAAGLVFYLALVFLPADGMLLHTGMTGGALYVPCLVVLPLLVMYMREPLGQLIEGRKLHVESFFDLFVGGFFEMFVTMLEYLANTVSFLRVGGFVLAHAGMMTVVMTLAEMSGGVFGAAVVVIGNLFVICLEGLIVGIQALRLNYYEVFSRFFEADGEAFSPLRLDPDTSEL